MRPMWLGRAVLAGCIAVAAFAGVAAADPRSDLFTYDYKGTVGPYRIGAELAIVGDREVSGGHYFYATKLTDIPLSGTIDADTVKLTEPGGGTFVLHFVGNGSNVSSPLGFENSVGLTGDWTGGGKTLPVKLDLSGGFDGGPPARRYQQVTDATDAAFETGVQAFVKNVLSGDKTAAAQGVSYPLHVYGTPKLVVRSGKDLVTHWNEIFNAKVLAAMRDTMPHDMFVHNGQAMIGQGLVWFDAKGVTSINEP